MNYINRHCKGDASETGLVQFAQGIMDLNETREKYNEIFYTDEKVQDYIDLIDNFDYDIDITTKKINEDLQQLNKTKQKKKKGKLI